MVPAEDLLTMPNRIIKESIWTSPNLNRLSPRAELHFYRILPSADDHGCFECTPSIVRGRCYPRKQDIRLGDIEKWQDELERNELIKRWHEEGRQYAILLNFQKHQRVRSVHLRKTPAPPAQLAMMMEAQTEQLVADESEDDDGRQVTSSDRLVPIPIHNPIHNPIPIPERESNKEKKPYGELKNVHLSLDEFEKLVDKFTEPLAREKIEKLSAYKKSKGKNYRDDYATILNWAMRDQEQQAVLKAKQDDPDRYVKGKYGHMVMR
jgi:hypothetical protein